MNTQLAVQPPVSTEVTPTQEKAWIGLALQKNLLSASLKTMELQAQSILLGVMQSQDYKAIDTALIAYRNLNTGMIEHRKPFTNAIDTGIVQPLMAFEKRVKDSPEYATLTARSLALRKAESDRANGANQKNQEIARFKAHVENEFFRVAAEYRGLLRKESVNQYEIALKEKLSGNTADIKRMMQTLAVPATNKFQTNLLTGEEMLSIFQGVTKPDYAGMYAEACKDLDKMFANFDSDMANAENALRHVQEQSKLTEIAETKQLQENVAINTLIANAETVIIEEPKIKRNLTVVVVESEVWAKSVMAAFIVNMPHLGKYIRVKSWSKLSIGQMAVALGQLSSETGITYTNIQLTEVEK